MHHKIKGRKCFKTINIIKNGIRWAKADAFYGGDFYFCNVYSTSSYNATITMGIRVAGGGDGMKVWGGEGGPLIWDGWMVVVEFGVLVQIVV